MPLEGESCECNCKTEFFGNLCEKDSCSIDPCMNGNCFANGFDYTCDCETFYEGENCDIFNPPSPCAEKPCHHGSCSDLNYTRWFINNIGVSIFGQLFLSYFLQ